VRSRKRGGGLSGAGVGTSVLMSQPRDLSLSPRCGAAGRLNKIVNI